MACFSGPQRDVYEPYRLPLPTLANLQTDLPMVSYGAPPRYQAFP